MPRRPTGGVENSVGRPQTGHQRLDGSTRHLETSGRSTQSLKILTEKIKVARQTVDSFKAQEATSTGMESRPTSLRILPEHFTNRVWTLLNALEAKETALVNILQTDEAARTHLQSQLSDVTTAFESAKKALRKPGHTQTAGLTTWPPSPAIRQQTEKDAGLLSGRIEAGNNKAGSHAPADYRH
jgi:hypothetical protein